jgi:hypothetical protein
MHRRCQWLVVEGCRDDGVGVGARTTAQTTAQDDRAGALARNLPETALHAASRRLTTRPSTAPLTSVVVWAREVLQGVVNSPSIDGKDGVAGSIPAGGSTTNQQARPGPTPGLSHRQGCALGPACHLRASKYVPTAVPISTSAARSRSAGGPMPRGMKHQTEIRCFTRPSQVEQPARDRSLHPLCFR